VCLASSQMSHMSLSLQQEAKSEGNIRPRD
jgi:hypothetical protein